MDARRWHQLWYAPVLALAMALMLVRTLAMARLLDLTAFAGFSAGVLVSGTFCMVGCLGLHQLLQREWPLGLACGRELRPMVRALQCLYVAAACCLAGLVAVAFDVRVGEVEPPILAIGLLHGLAHQFFLVATVESRSRGEALRFSLQNLLRALIVLVPGVLLALWTGSALLVLAIDALVTAAVSAGYLHGALRRTGRRAGLVAAAAWRGLSRIRWRSPATLMVVAALSFVLLNLDRWAAAAWADATSFAVYAFAGIVLTIAQSLQTLLNASVYPLIARRYAAHGAVQAFALSRLCAVGVVAAGTLLSVPVWFGAGFAVRHGFPQYADALALLPPLLAVAVLRVSDFWTGFLLVAGHESWLLRLNLAALGVGTGLWLVAVQPGSDAAPSLGEIVWLPVLLTGLSYAFTVAVARQACLQQAARGKQENTR